MTEKRAGILAAVSDWLKLLALVVLVAEGAIIAAMKLTPTEMPIHSWYPVFMLGFLLVVVIGIFVDRYLQKVPDSREPSSTEPIDFTYMDTSEFHTVHDVVPHMKALIGGLQREGEIEILNYGLDLEVVQTFITYQFILTKDLSAIRYKALVINPRADAIAPYIDGSSNISSRIANQAVNKIGGLCKQHRVSLEERNIQIELRSYDTPPVFHGFLVNGKYLYLGFTELRDRKLQGGQFPYLFLTYDKDSKESIHYFHFFKSWFEKTWYESEVKVRSNKC